MEQVMRAELMDADIANFPILAPPAGSFSLSTSRTFQPGLEMRSEYPQWYRRFPMISAFKISDPMGDAVLQTPYRPRMPAGATYNSPTIVYDLYTPRFTRGSGREKQGLCPLCAELPERGGEGTEYWFSMKISAFNYHMCNSHGISASTKLPFSPPIGFRSIRRIGQASKYEKFAVLEGKCHECEKFIPLESMKIGDVKVREIYWWKHAAKCHQGAIEGECDIYYEDEILARVKAWEKVKKAQAQARGLIDSAADKNVPVPPAYIRADSGPALNMPLASYPLDLASHGLTSDVAVLTGGSPVPSGSSILRSSSFDFTTSLDVEGASAVYALP
ncbi:hypothetical protein BKA62DRAFT_1098 [Auriculariales sp. MPI-PUGE-AT-0066]|nr:hypothetical protein BKA62DRAFT_1098 [Auriculariales sp. MPI-PUGE-AT-0066]